jgi:pimeloyl-ACP methyl ester carboxylesterase
MERKEMSSQGNVRNSCVTHRGCKLSYSTYGSGEPVLLIQGAGVHRYGWEPQLERLAQRYCCLYFDNRGLGQSQPVGEELTIKQMAEDACRLMDAEGWNSAHVVGHSMGGLIALQLALSARQRVRSLSLLCTFARGSDVTKLSAWMLWIGLRTKIGTKPMRRRAFMEMVMPPQVLNDDNATLANRLAELYGHDLAVQPDIIKGQLSAMARCDLTPRLHELSGIPTLVVSAGSDRIAHPQFGRAIAEGVPNARYVEVAGAGHAVTIHDAPRMNDLLMQHLSSAVQPGMSAAQT